MQAGDGQCNSAALVDVEQVSHPRGCTARAIHPTRVFGLTPPNNRNNSHSVHLRRPGAARPQTGLGQLAPASPSRHNITPVAAESSQLLRLAASHRHPHVA
jgi:hypothetical protein